MEEFELEPGEQVIQSARKHWIIFALRLLPYAILALLPFFIPIALATLAKSGVGVPALDLHFAVFALALWWLVLWIGSFNAFVQYFLNQWIITTTRIVEIHQYGFFRRTVSSFLLDRVQDVTTSVDGVLATMIGFGTLNVETAGRDEKFQMAGIPDPEAMRDLIMREVAALHADRGDQSGV